jgi:U4/U6.U5 tri-snRNP-associated protein 3
MDRRDRDRDRDRGARSRSRSRDRGGSSRNGGSRDYGGAGGGGGGRDRDRYERGGGEPSKWVRDTYDAAGVALPTAPKPSKPLTREEIEAQRKERVELVKRLTQGDRPEAAATGAGAASSSSSAANGTSGDGDATVGEDEEEEDEEEEMARMLGFGGFGSTKGQQVLDNQEGPAAGGLRKHKARKYRQYMNRKSGFNKPLAKMD